MSRVIKAPEVIDTDMATVFLAGSIENGEAPNWQKEVGDFFVEYGYVVLNPRRDDWDSSWKQSMNDPQFYEQVNWELNAMNTATAIFIYFDPQTKAPITLMELGLYANSGKVFVVCPDGYWRKGNVEIVCKRYNIPLHNSLEAFYNTARLMDLILKEQENEV